MKHRFEDAGGGLVVKTVKNSMQEGYWFVKLCEDAAPSLQKIKQIVLLFMKQLRKDLGRDVHLS